MQDQEVIVTGDAAKYIQYSSTRIPDTEERSSSQDWFSTTKDPSTPIGSERWHHQGCPHPKRGRCIGWHLVLQNWGTNTLMMRFQSGGYQSVRSSCWYQKHRTKKYHQYPTSRKIGNGHKAEEDQKNTARVKRIKHEICRNYQEHVLPGVWQQKGWSGSPDYWRHATCQCAECPPQETRGHSFHMWIECSHIKEAIHAGRSCYMSKGHAARDNDNGGVRQLVSMAVIAADWLALMTETGLKKNIFLETNTVAISDGKS